MRMLQRLQKIPAPKTIVGSLHLVDWQAPTRELRSERRQQKNQQSAAPSPPPPPLRPPRQPLGGPLPPPSLAYTKIPCAADLRPVPARRQRPLAAELLLRSEPDEENGVGKAVSGEAPSPSSEQPEQMDDTDDAPSPTLPDKSRLTERRRSWLKRRESGKSTFDLLAEHLRTEAKRLPKKVDFAAVVRALARKHKAVAALRKCAIFESLDEIQLAMLAYTGEVVTLSRYGVLYRAGASATSFYILLRGSIQQMYDEGDTNAPTTSTIRVTLDESSGVVFGTEALHSQVRRQSTMVAANNACELLLFNVRNVRLDRSGIKKLAETVFSKKAEEALRATPVFRDLEPKSLRSIAPLFTLEEAQADDAIFVEGAPCDKLYILLQGVVDVTHRGTYFSSLDGSQTLVGDGHPFFGAAGFLLGNARRPWDVHARTPVHLLVLPMRRLQRFMARVPDFKQRLQSFSELRRRNWELKTGQPLPTVADAASSMSTVEALGAISPSMETTSPLIKGSSRRLSLSMSKEPADAVLVMQASTRGMLARRHWGRAKKVQQQIVASAAEALGSPTPPDLQVQPQSCGAKRGATASCT
jgi:CRP-like cAMP-binding protein